MLETKDALVYLRNPLFLERSGMKSFDYLKKKVRNRLEGWMARVMSKVG